MTPAPRHRGDRQGLLGDPRQQRVLHRGGAGSDAYFSRDRGPAIPLALPPAGAVRLAARAATAGCSRWAAASGSTASSWPECGFDVTAVDLTESAHRRWPASSARRRGVTIDFRLGNAEGLDFADESFDAVYSFGVLHHTPDIERAVDEVHRVLRPGGTAYVMLYHRWSLVNLVHRVLRLPYESPRDRKDHCPVVYTFSRRGVRRLFGGFSRRVRDGGVPVHVRLRLRRHAAAACGCGARSAGRSGGT